MIDKEIIKIASNTENHGVLDNHTHFSKLKNPVCGDEMKVYLIIKNNCIANFKYECESCIYCQASVSLLSRKSINKSINSIKELLYFVETFFEKDQSVFPKEWSVFNKLFSKKNISRKECLLLPFKTVSKALKL